LRTPLAAGDDEAPPVLPRHQIPRPIDEHEELQHRILIGLLYGCGLRCQEVRSLELKHLDFDRRLVHVVQSKGGKDRYLPLSEHLVRGIRTYLSAERPKSLLFEGSGNPEGKGFDSRYSQRGVQWAVKTVARQAGIIKDVHTHMLRHSYATHLLEDGVNIITVQKLMGHQNIQSTMVYLHVCHLPEKLPHSPLDKVFVQCSRYGK